MDFHAEADVGLVAAVAVHGVVPAHARDLRGDVDIDDGLEKVAHHAFEEVQDVLLFHEAHLAVDLGELGLAVGAQVFIAEAAHDLEVAVVACHHQKLLEGLRALRQGVEFAGVHAAGHHEVAGSLRGGLDEAGSLDLHETLAIQIVADLMCHAVTQHQRFLERVAAQVQIAVSSAQLLAAVADILDGERRDLRRIQHIHLVEKDLDVAGVHLRVLALTFRHTACNLDYVFTAEACDCGFHRLVAGWVCHQLSYAVAVAKVHECHSSHLPDPLHPSGESHGLPCI